MGGGYSILLSMIRVLVFSYEFVPIGGGVGRALESLLLEFIDRDKVQIDLVTASVNGRFARKDLAGNVRVHFLPGFDHRGRLSWQTSWDMVWFWGASYFYTWWLVLRGRRFDLTHTFGYPGGLVSWLFAWKWPYVISLRGIEVPGYNRKFWGWYVVYRWLARLIWGRAAAVIANGEWLRGLALDTSPGLVVKVIGNGVDTETFRPVGKKNSFKNFTVTAGGTLMGRRKNLEVLVRAFGLLYAKYSDVRLLLIGDGAQKSRLEGLVVSLGLGSGVRFAGRRERKWLAANLPRCSVMCLPSSGEGMSNAVLEAMACGLPLVVSSVSSELVLGNGFVADEVDEIFEALEKIYLESGLRAKMGKRSRELALGRSWNGVAGEYLGVYEITQISKIKSQNY